jgi:hypothetical protein
MGGRLGFGVCGCKGLEKEEMGGGGKGRENGGGAAAQMWGLGEKGG